MKTCSINLQEAKNELRQKPVLLIIPLLFICMLLYEIHQLQLNNAKSLQQLTAKENGTLNHSKRNFSWNIYCFILLFLCILPVDSYSNERCSKKNDVTPQSHELG